MSTHVTERDTLPRAFFERDARSVARELLGNVLVRQSPEGETCGVIVETEAYLGPTDDAAHSYKGKTERVRALYGPKGCAYVYLIYGMHWCLNISAGADETPECVLIRALEPVSGFDLMEQRRGTNRLLNLCSGPGKLCAALDIGRAQYGADLCARAGLSVEQGVPPEKITATKRVGIAYAEKCRDELWRYIVDGNPYVSRSK